MTVYEDEIPARRSGVGTKVLGLACAIMVILAAFWGIVWFIRSYVEPPRVLMPAALQFASRDSVSVPVPKVAVERRSEAAKPVEAPAPPAPPPQIVAAPRPASPGPIMAEQSSNESVADRWGPMNQLGITPRAAPAPAAAAAPQPAPVLSAPATAEPAPGGLATVPERDADEVVEGSVPAIDGPAPLPRRRPVMTAQRRSNDPPLPRPRPDGQVAPPPSVFTAVPTTDDRYPGQ
jgi:hypothetical protein